MEIEPSVNKNKIDQLKTAARVFIVEDEPTTKSGFDVIKELNRLNIPSILITGTTSDATLLKLADLDVYGFLPKPFDQAALATALQLGLKKFTRMQDKIFEEADAIKSRILATKALEEEFGINEKFFLSKKNNSAAQYQTVAGVDYHQRIQWLTGAGILIVVTSFLGYLFDVPWLLSYSDSSAAIKINAMFCLLLLGASLLAENRIQPSPTLKNFSLLTLILCSLISGLTLLQYLLPVNFGLDELVAKDRYIDEFNQPGRMAITTAISVLALAGALLSNRLKTFKFHINVTEGLALLTLALSALGILGYVFRLSKFNQLIPYSSQPRPTLLVLLLFTVSVFYLNPRKGLMSILSNRRVSAKMGRRMLLGINGLLILLSIAIFYLVPKSNYDGLEVLFLLIISVAVLSLVIIWATLKLIRNEIQFERSVHLIENRERELQFVLKRVPNPVAVLDRHMRYILASRKWIDDFNLKDKNIIGRSHFEVFPDLSEDIKQLHQRALSGETVNAEVDNLFDATGRRMKVKGEIRPWFDIHNQIAGVIMFVESVTYPTVQAAPTLDQ